MRGARLAFCCLLIATALPAAAGAADQSAPDQPGPVLRHADHIKTADNAQFAEILSQMQSRRDSLSATQRQWLDYLQIWQMAYVGQVDKAIPRLRHLAGHALDPALGFRAQGTLADILHNVSRYQEAYSGLEKIIEQAPAIKNDYDRAQGFIDAGIILADGGQAELSLEYARKAADATDMPSVRCYANYIRFLVYSRKNALGKASSQLGPAIAPCLSDHNVLFANSIRAFFIKNWLSKGEFRKALKELNAHYQETQDTNYWELKAQYDSLLAMSYLQAHEWQKAEYFALRVVEPQSGEKNTLATRDAFRVLVEVASQRKDWQKALAWEKKFIAANKGYLNEVSARALAYQKVRQKVRASETQAEAAQRENRILRLRQTLMHKSAETSRLYAALFGLLAVFLGIWIWRLIRSRRRFRILARRDSLTGIFNRQHFLAVAQSRLDYCEHSRRDASLILMDLDHFKHVNDDHGHATGDAVLKRAAAVCVDHLRSVDVYGRLGGEEFGILLPECDLDCAKICAERIRLAIANSVSRDGDTQVAVTASLGVADVRVAGYDLKNLMRHADLALYRAKDAGRDCVAT